jgi:GntR family transcriptional regulator
MLFDAIQPDSDVPAYEQIVAQVTFGIAAGFLEVGEIIPSVRKLAEIVLVHPNTVAKAFHDLERDGILETRPGKGMEVTPEAPRVCQAERQKIVRNRIRAALREAVQSALPAEEIRRLVEEELSHVNGQRRHREKP